MADWFVVCSPVQFARPKPEPRSTSLVARKDRLLACKLVLNIAVPGASERAGLTLRGGRPQDTVSVFSVANAGGDYIRFFAAADGFCGLDDAVQIVLWFEAESGPDFGQIKRVMDWRRQAGIGVDDTEAFGQTRDSLSPVDDHVARQVKLLADGFLPFDG